MKLDDTKAKLFEKLVSIEYLKLCLQRAKKKKQKERIKETVKKLEEELVKYSLWDEMREGLKIAISGKGGVVRFSSRM